MSVDPLLRSKLQRAAIAILDSHSLLICSGSGMTAECSIPKNFPKEELIDSERHLLTTNGLMAFPEDGL